MDEDCDYDVLEELEELDEVAVPQVDNRDTAPMDVPFRASTHSDWPPEPPLPADVDLAVGTLTEGVPPPRTARIFAAVRRPTTSSDTNDDGD